MQAPIDELLEEMKALKKKIATKNNGISESSDVKEILQHIVDQKKLASDTHSEIMDLKDAIAFEHWNSAGAEIQLNFVA